MPKKQITTIKEKSLPSNENTVGRPIEPLKDKELARKYLIRAKREVREGVLKHLDFDSEYEAWKVFDGLQELDKKAFGPALDAWVQENMSSDGRTRMLTALRKADFAKKNLRSIDLSADVAERLSYEAKRSGQTISDFLDGLMKRKTK
jgi:macrodomain Ter protein organizer (MatP/YcbG family)